MRGDRRHRSYGYGDKLPEGIHGGTMRTRTTSPTRLKGFANPRSNRSQPTGLSRQSRSTGHQINMDQYSTGPEMDPSYVTPSLGPSTKKYSSVRNQRHMTSSRPNKRGWGNRKSRREDASDYVPPSLKGASTLQKEGNLLPTTGPFVPVQELPPPSPGWKKFIRHRTGRDKPIRQRDPVPWSETLEPDMETFFKTLWSDCMDASSCMLCSTPEQHHHHYHQYVLEQFPSWAADEEPEYVPPTGRSKVNRFGREDKPKQTKPTNDETKRRNVDIPETVDGNGRPMKKAGVLNRFARFRREREAAEVDSVASTVDSKLLSARSVVHAFDKMLGYVDENESLYSSRTGTSMESDSVVLAMQMMIDRAQRWVDREVHSSQGDDDGASFITNDDSTIRTEETFENRRDQEQNSPGKSPRNIFKRFGFGRRKDGNDRAVDVQLEAVLEEGEEEQTSDYESSEDPNHQVVVSKTTSPELLEAQQMVKAFSGLMSYPGVPDDDGSCNSRELQEAKLLSLATGHQALQTLATRSNDEMDEVIARMENLIHRAQGWIEEQKTVVEEQKSYIEEEQKKDVEEQKSYIEEENEDDSSNGRHGSADGVEFQVEDLVHVPSYLNKPQEERPVGLRRLFSASPKHGANSKATDIETSKTAPLEANQAKTPTIAVATNNIDSASSPPKKTVSTPKKVGESPKASPFVTPQRPNSKASKAKSSVAAASPKAVSETPNLVSIQENAEESLEAIPIANDDTEKSTPVPITREAMSDKNKTKESMTPKSFMSKTPSVGLSTPKITNVNKTTAAAAVTPDSKADDKKTVAATSQSTPVKTTNPAKVTTSASTPTRAANSAEVTTPKSIPAKDDNSPKVTTPKAKCVRTITCIEATTPKAKSIKTLTTIEVTTPKSTPVKNNSTPNKSPKNEQTTKRVKNSPARLFKKLTGSNKKTLEPMSEEMKEDMTVVVTTHCDTEDDASTSIEVTPAGSTPYDSTAVQEEKKNEENDEAKPKVQTESKKDEEKVETKPNIHTATKKDEEKVETKPKSQIVQKQEEKKAEVKPKTQTVQKEEKKVDVKPKTQTVEKKETKKVEVKPKTQTVQKKETKKVDVKPKTQTVPKKETKKVEVKPKTQTVQKKEEKKVEVKPKTQTVQKKEEKKVVVKPKTQTVQKKEEKKVVVKPKTQVVQKKETKKVDVKPKNKSVRTKGFMPFSKKSIPEDDKDEESTLKTASSSSSRSEPSCPGTAPADSNTFIEITAGPNARDDTIVAGEYPVLEFDPKLVYSKSLLSVDSFSSMENENDSSESVEPVDDDIRSYLTYAA